MVFKLVEKHKTTEKIKLNYQSFKEIMIYKIKYK